MVYFTFPLECMIGISKLGTAKTERASFPHRLSKWDCIYTHLSKWLSNPSRIQWLRPKILWLTLIPFTSYVQPVIKPWRSYLQKRIWLFMTSIAFISFGAYHFLLRLPKQHPKRSSCLCPFTVILKSSPRVMLLKMYGRSCHSSVQNLPSALHLRVEVQEETWLQTYIIYPCPLPDLYFSDCISLYPCLCSFPQPHQHS